MNGSGCKSCPVSPCNTLYYRGSYCIEQRAKHGLGDPMTNSDRFRAMSDDDLAELISDRSVESLCDIVCGGECKAIPTSEKSAHMMCVEIVLKYLQQPPKGE